MPDGVAEDSPTDVVHPPVNIHGTSGFDTPYYRQQIRHGKLGNRSVTDNREHVALKVRQQFGLGAFGQCRRGFGVPHTPARSPQRCLPLCRTAWTWWPCSVRWGRCGSPAVAARRYVSGSERHVWV
ncbi:MAG: hypothetical protein M3A44_00375 [Gammaproteobacteria bacterium]